MSSTYKICGRWQFAVADDAYRKNGSGTIIGAQTHNTYQYSTYYATPLPYFIEMIQLNISMCSYNIMYILKRRA